MERIVIHWFIAIMLIPKVMVRMPVLLALYLFIHPIWHILKNTKDAPELQRLLTKYILISVIAIFSNLFSSIWFAVTDILIFAYFDTF